MHLDAPLQGQLDEVVATLERARYGAPGADLPDISAQVRAVVHRVRSTRQEPRTRTISATKASMSASVVSKAVINAFVAEIVRVLGS